MTGLGPTWCEGQGLQADETPLEACPVETQSGMGFMPKIFGNGSKTSSARGNERGNNLLFQRGERAGVRVERRVEKKEREVSC